MPTDLEIIEAEEAGGQRPKPDTRGRLGLFVLFIFAFLLLAGVSVIFNREPGFRPWLTLPSVGVVQRIEAPHLRGGVFLVAKSQKTLSDDISGQLDLPTFGGNAFHTDFRALGLLGATSTCKIDLSSGPGGSATLFARSDGRRKSIALLTPVSTNSTRVLLLDHVPDPGAPYHVRHLKAGEHHLTATTPGPPHAAGMSMGLDAYDYATTDPLPEVIDYYLREFKPVPPDPRSHHPALLLSPADTNAAHFSMFLQSNRGPIFVHAARDAAVGETRVAVIEFP